MGEERTKHRVKHRIAVVGLTLAICAMIPFGVVEAAHAELTTQSVCLLPDVTDDMTNPSYWSNKQPNPNEILADRKLINGLNRDGVNGEGTMLQPLRTARVYYYDADQQTTLKNAAQSELESEFVGVAQDENGAVMTEADAAEIVANYPTDGGAPEIASQYAIVTTHTTMRAYPTDRMIGLTPGDNDDDNLFLSALRVNEPLIVRAQSVDKQFLFCISSCIGGAWVPAKDVAICANKVEWLAAWDIPQGHELVVVGYKVRTEQSRVTANTANRMLYMGTVLESVDLGSPEDALELVGTRSAYYNHVCYMPVRNADGTYSKEPALIASSAQVSEGFLPLTKANIAKVAFNSLGQMYGWGGMLEANDCSGYVRDVYKCFGLELARNTTWQMNLPVRKYDLTGLDDAHKAAAIAQMPLGTVLFWGGHEMIYLGQENGKLYVISSLGGIGDIYGNEETSYQVKSVAINTLDMLRWNRSTWLSMLTTANIPYIPGAEVGADLLDIAFYADGATWPGDSYSYTGKPIVKDVKIPGLEKGVDYNVVFANNKEVGTASVTLTGAGLYSGKVSRTFKIVPVKDTRTPIGGASIRTQKQVYTGKPIKPKPLVVLGKILLDEGVDYKLSYANNTKAGTATITVTGKGAYRGTASATFAIAKASQAITAKASVSKRVTVSSKTKKLAKSASFSLKSLAKVSAKTAVKFTKANQAGGKLVVVNAKTGKVTAKKGLAKGTYKVKVKLTAPSGKNYKAAKAKSITLKLVAK